MRQDIRLQILCTAKELFNERGFNEVSTRDIAQVLGISKGNLTYHFKKKEDIMEAILSEIPGIPPPDAPTTLLELDDYFRTIQTVVQDNAFYFWHYTQLSQLSPTIQHQQRLMYRSAIDKLKKTFQLLLEGEFLRAECYPGEYDRIIDTLHLTSIYWIPFCALKDTTAEDSSFQMQAWSILAPLLTEKSRAALHGLL